MVALTGVSANGQVSRQAYNDWNISDGISFGALSGSEVSTQTISSLFRPIPQYAIALTGVYARSAIAQSQRLNLLGFGLSGDPISAASISGADVSNTFLETSVSISFPVSIAQVHSTGVVGGVTIHADCNVVTLSQVHATGAISTSQEKDSIRTSSVAASGTLGSILVKTIKTFSVLPLTSGTGALTGKNTFALNSVHSTSAIGTPAAGKQKDINIPQLHTRGILGKYTLANSNIISQLSAAGSGGIPVVITTIKSNKVSANGAINLTKNAITHTIQPVTATSGIGNIANRSVVALAQVSTTSALSNFTTHSSRPIGIVGVYSRAGINLNTKQITKGVGEVVGSGATNQSIPTTSNIITGISSTAVITPLSISADHTLEVTQVSSAASIGVFTHVNSNPITGISANSGINNLTTFLGEKYLLTQTDTATGGVGTLSFSLTQNIPLPSLHGTVAFGVTTHSTVFVFLPTIAANSEIGAPNSLIVESNFNKYNAIYAKPRTTIIHAKSQR